MERQYVEERDGGYWIAGTRVSLDSIVVAFLQGLSPDAIALEGFPILTLEQVYGALAFYLANREEIDRYLEKADQEFAALREESRRLAPQLFAKLEEAGRHPSRTRQ